MDSNRPVLAITPGEPAGIGPEIFLQQWSAHPAAGMVAVADPALLQRTAGRLEIDVEIAPWQPGSPLRKDAVNCLPVMLDETEQPGQLNPANAAYVLQTLKTATSLVQQGDASALVTGPVHKGVINDAGHPFSGHTEFLAQQASVSQVVMMLAAPGLRVCLVTTHLPLRAVAEAITPEKLEAVISITESALRNQFGIVRPAIQVLGLNPHAGEGGHLGHEDGEIIEPVIQRLRNGGMDLHGPVPADTAFTPPRLATCDAVVAMYHDQGLPVLKHLGFGHSVNITLGLPFVRTSVDHGTALDLAGSGTADTGSMAAAVTTAHNMVKRASSD